MKRIFAKSGLRQHRGGQRRDARNPVSRRRVSLGCILQLSIAAIVIFLLAFGFTVVGYASIASALPAPDELQVRAANFKSGQIMARDGTLLSELFDADAGRRVPVVLSEISPYLVQATIAVEDPNFYIHPGVDPVGVARAIYHAFQAGEIVSGGSTIAQQLVKLVFLSPEQTVSRKVREAFLAAEITRRYPRDLILQIYLNEIYYGNFAYGVETAAQTYYNRPAKDLTLAQAALLAGLPQAPAYFDLYTQWERAKQKQQLVLSLMVRHGYITPEEADEAWLEPIELIPLHFETNTPHFVQYVRQQLEQELGPQVLYKGGLRITTTLDPDLQKQAEEISRRRVSELADRQAHNAALVAIQPGTGDILAMVGSVDFNDATIAGQINMALAPRQPGSTLKPFTYLTAFGLSEDWWTPATTILDVETEFPDGVNPPYIPHNYDQKEHGLVSVRSALANSFNIPAVKALEHIGVPALLEMMQRFGVTTLTRPDYGLSLTLGGGDVSLLELTGAYATLASGGVRVPPRVVLRVEDTDGRLISEASTPAGMFVADPRHVYLITSILADKEARRPMFGPNSVLNLSRPAAVKTGTTDDYRDAWTVGYTPDLAVGVWVGNADRTAMDRLSGVRAAGPIWRDFMEVAQAEETALSFPVPSGLIRVEVCADSGTLPGEFCPARRSEVFAEDRGPLGPEHDIHRRVRVYRLGDREYLAPDDCPDALVEERNYVVYPLEGREWAEKHDIPQPPTEVAGECLAPQVAVVTPVEGETVRGIVGIFGQADAPEFDRYVVEYGVSVNPLGWGIVAEGRERHSQPGLLAQWDTRGLHNMAHTVRVVTYDRRGNAYYSQPVHVTVANATPTPMPTYTPFPSPSPSPTFTSTPRTILPTATPSLVPPSATHTPVLPVSTSIPLLPTSTATSAPDVQLTAEILSPSEGDEVRGMMEISGRATGEDFARYRLDVGAGTQPRAWLNIGAEGTLPVGEGRLAVWDTQTLPNGLYTLRLMVFDAEGNALTDRRTVRVVNG